MGCSEACSMPAAAASTPSMVAPSTARTAATSGLPAVNVPVLSNATHVIAPRRSRYAPPLTSTPARAADVRAATIDTGVESTRAHGQATASRASARYVQVETSPPASTGGTTATRAASTTTAGV